MCKWCNCKTLPLQLFLDSPAESVIQFHLKGISEAPLVISESVLPATSVRAFLILNLEMRFTLAWFGASFMSHKNLSILSSSPLTTDDSPLRGSHNGCGPGRFLTASTLFLLN